MLAISRLLKEASETDGSTAVFAYTVKGWGLQSAADPRNHAATLTPEQYDQLAEAVGRDTENPWERFPKDSPEGEYLAAASKRLGIRDKTSEPPLRFNDTDIIIPNVASTQDAFGRMLLELDRTSPESAGRIVTTTADVATSNGRHIELGLSEMNMFLLL